MLKVLSGRGLSLEILRKLPFAPVTSPLFQISDFCPTDGNFLYGSNQSCWCLSFGFCFWFCFWLWLSSGFPLAHCWFPVSSCCSSLPTTRGRSFLSHHMTALGLSRKSRLFSKTSSISEEAPTGCRSVRRAERHHHSHSRQCWRVEGGQPVVASLTHTHRKWNIGQT